jgi:4-amino-4-deoxy-L-arabinose transferase-like glycosyltransferase
VLLILVCVLPWVVALGSAVGWRSLPEAMLSDMVPKLTGVQESHAGFPGYYLLLAPVTFWPSSLFLLVALLHGWKHRQRPAERFLLAWLVPTWLLFELVPTKLPHYVLPTFPALALLAGRGVCAAPATLQPLLQRPAVRTALCAWGLILVVITVAVLIGVRHLDATALAYAGAVIGVVVGVGTGGACMMLVWRNSLRCAVVVGATGAALLFAVLLGTVLPGLDALWLSRRIASVAEAISPRRGWLAVGYAEPSLMLLARVPVRRTELEAAVDALEGPEPPLVLVSDSHREAFLGAVRRRGLRPRQRGSVMGFDYTHGRWITVELFGAE